MNTTADNPVKLHSNPAKDHLEGVDYTVKVNGEVLDLFRASEHAKVREPESFYAFGSFDMGDGDAVIEITSARDLSRTKILPEKNFLEEICRSADKLILKASEPFTVSVEPNGRFGVPLLLFGKAPEQNIPDKSDPNVIWFGPGEHSPGRIELKSGQTLYLESGSLVHAVLEAEGDNIRICGRGVLSQEKFPRGKGMGTCCLNFRHCRNLLIEGIISKDPRFWDLVLRDCQDVRIDGIALCGSRMANDDALDICNSSRVVIQNTFLRAMDDIIAVKGEPDLTEIPNDPTTDQELGTAQVLDRKFYGPERAVSDLEIRNCVFWCDCANVFRIGFECTAPFFRNFHIHDLEVIHASAIYHPPTEFWAHNIFMFQASCGISMEDMVFERIRVHSDGLGMLLISLRSEECRIWKKFGSIRRCLFKDISVTGKPGDFQGEVFLQRKDESGNIEEIQLQNITYFGEKKTAENTPVYTDGNVKKPEFI